MYCLIISVLGALLLINAAIGHGTWLLLAAIFRGKRKTCPRCNARLSARQCTGCLWPDRIDPSVVTERELKRLLNKGAIDIDVFSRVVMAINAAPHSQPRAVVPMATLVRAEVNKSERTSDPQHKIGFVPALDPPLSVEAETPESPVVSARVGAEIPSPSPPPKPVPIPVSPAAPRKPMAQIMASFMEARNIRWGELIGGLLVVGCSVALVISLWSRIADQPILKFLVFDLVTAALFGLGLYSHHRWRLPLTSRGILVTATLMVPLASLASAAFSEGPAASNAVAIASQAVSLMIFAILLWLSSRAISAHWPALLTTIVLSSSMILPVIRYVSPGTARMPGGRLLLLEACPLVSYEIVMIVALLRARRWVVLGTIECRAILLLLGIASFSMSVPAGLVVYKAGVSLSTLRALAPLVALAGWPALAVGLLLWRRLNAAAMAEMRTGGIATGIFGTALLVGGMVLSWPMPVEILPVALIDCGILLAVAVLFDIPAAILPAGLCLVWAYLNALHLIAGTISWHADSDTMLRAILSTTTAAGLLPLFIVVAGVSEMLSRLGRKQHARSVAIIAASCAAFSLALITRNTYVVSVASPVSAAIYAFYAAAAMCAAWRFRRPWATWAGWILLLPAIQQLPFLTPTKLDSWSLALLTEASAATIAALICRQVGGRLAAIFSTSSRAAALIGSSLAVVPLAIIRPFPGCDLVAQRLLWTSIIVGIFWLLETSPGYFALFQFLLTTTAIFSISGRLMRQSWFAHSDSPLSDPRTIQSYAIVFAALGLTWGVLRLILRKSPRLFPEKSWSVDKTFTALATVLLWTLAVISVLPGVSSEFSSSALTIRSHVLSDGAGSWTLLVLLAAAVLAEIFTRPGLISLQVLVAVLFSACPLLAAGCEGQNAVASALRWSAAAYLLMGTIPVWARGKFSSDTSRFGDKAIIQTGRLILLLGGGVILLLTIYPSWLAVIGSPPPGPAAGSFFARIGNSVSYLLPLACVIATLIGYAIREHSPIYAFVGSLVVNLAVTLGYLLAHVGAPFDIDRAGRLLQLNTAALASFALGWLLILRLSPSGPKARTLPRLLMAQIWLAVAGLFAWIIPADLCLLVSPARFILPAGLGDIFGWIAALVTGAAFLAMTLLTRPRVAISLAASGLVVLATMAALTVAQLGGNAWSASHILLSSHVAAAWAILAITHFLMTRRSQQIALIPGLAVSPGENSGESLLPPSPGTPGEGQGGGPMSEGRSAATGQSETPQPPPQPSPGVPGEGGSLALSIISLPSPDSNSANAPTIPLDYQRPLNSSAPSEIDEADRATACRWMVGIGCAVVFMALRIALQDPQRPWWSAGAILFISLLAAAVACWRLAPHYIYAAGSLFNLAVTLWWVHSYWQWGASSLADLVNVNIIALTSPALAWLILELEVFRPNPAVIAIRRPFHSIAALASTTLVLLLVTVGLQADAVGTPLHLTVWIAWAALASTAALLVGCLCDARMTGVVPALYVLGLSTAGLTVEQFHLHLNELAPLGAVILSAYALATSALFYFRNRLARWMIRDRDEAATAIWLIPANLSLAAISIALGFWADFAVNALLLRLAVATAVMSQPLSVGLLARGNRRLRLEQTALILAVVAAAIWGWSWSPPADLPMNRLAMLTTVLIIMTAIYAAGSARFLPAANLWAVSAKRLLSALLSAALAGLLATLGLEIFQQVELGHVTITPFDTAAIGLALALAIGAAIVMAVMPGRDPLRLSARGRTAYVYAAEIFLAMTFLHLRLTMPWLFTGYFQRYWPLVVIAISFAGVALSELFRRRQQMILAEPLQNTGAFLPLLPALAFWALHSNVDYSTFLLLAGILYSVLAILRRSFGFGLLAALAGNGALWHVLDHLHGFGFLIHPQYWLIPFALCFLVATHLNRSQLSIRQVQTSHYACLTLIYLSSTADMFLNGVRQCPYLVYILGAISIAGVMAGIIFRIRSFLFLGTAFLVLTLITIIWHASVDLHQTWLIWVSGIALGVSIILLFALFEKKRGEVHAVIDGLREWQG